MVTQKAYAKLKSLHGYDTATDIKKLMELIEHVPHQHLLPTVDFTLCFKTAVLPTIAYNLGKSCHYRSDDCRFERTTELSFRVWGITAEVYKALNFLLGHL